MDRLKDRFCTERSFCTRSALAARRCIPFTFKRLQRDDLVFVNDFARELVKEVLSFVCYASHADALLVLFASSSSGSDRSFLLFARQATLCLLQVQVVLGLPLLKPPEVTTTSVMPRSMPTVFRLFLFAGETDKVAPCRVFRERDRRDVARVRQVRLHRTLSSPGTFATLSALP